MHQQVLKRQSMYHRHSDEFMNDHQNRCVSSVSNTIEQQSGATRMSSGYFSGDEFRSHYNNNNTIPNNSQDVISQLIISSPPQVVQPKVQQQSTNQFNINKFLNTQQKHARSSACEALDDFNLMYKKIDLECDGGGDGSSSEEIHQDHHKQNGVSGRYGQVNIHLNQPLNGDGTVYELIEDLGK